MATISKKTSLSLTGLLTMLLLTLFLGVAHAGIDVSQLNVNDIQQQLPAELANKNLTLDDAKTLLKDKCVAVAGKEAGEQAYQEIEAATMVLFECVTDIVNYTAVQAEIEEAKPRGELDVVFNKYCNKRAHTLECIETFNGRLVPCLDNEEKDNQDVFMRIVRSLLNFVCYKGGDQIALFIAEKGPECLESKKDDIQQCINSTFADYMPQEGLENVKSLPKFVMGPKQCDDMQRLETCIVEKLEKCEEITPANIVESMFRFIKNETICRTGSSAAAKHAGKSSIAATIGACNWLSMTAAFVALYVASKRLTTSSSS